MLKLSRRLLNMVSGGRTGLRSGHVEPGYNFSGYLFNILRPQRNALDRNLAHLQILQGRQACILQDHCTRVEAGGGEEKGKPWLPLLLKKLAILAIPHSLLSFWDPLQPLVTLPQLSNLFSRGFGLLSAGLCGFVVSHHGGPCCG